MEGVDEMLKIYRVESTGKQGNLAQVTHRYEVFF